MDRRVFEPRPTGNDARRRSAMGMAAAVLVAAWLWLSMSHSGAPTLPRTATVTHGQHTTPADR